MKNISLAIFCLLSLAASSQTVGWFYSNPGSLDGYVLFAPGSSDSTYLIDKCGKRIHTWHSNYHPGLAVYLLPDGNLLRCGSVGNGNFQAGGSGGMIEKFDWNSNLLWSYQISDNSQCQHHDAIQLPNGNIVAIAWETHTQNDAQNNGRTSVASAGMWSEKLVELQPVGNNSANIVWEWRAWDHLVQDVDITKPSYGTISDHPELININLGTVNNTNKDWLHMNGLDYDSVHDQILVSSRYLSEVLIIDHSTTLAEAATHSGGNSGHGGDLLYRWGNPQNYGRGTSSDKKFFDQHNPSFIPPGYPGAGDIMVFNNGVNRPGTDYVSIETITPPAEVNYNFPIDPDSAYQPTAEDWIFVPTPNITANAEGGAQRLQNGNTLVCQPQQGTFFEVDSNGNYEWKYISPVGNNGNIITQGSNPSQNSLFRVTFLPSQYAGLAGQLLVPGAPIELNPLNYNCDNFATTVSEINVDADQLTAYPNPFQNGFSIHVPVDVSHATLQIHDVMGRLLYEDKNFSSHAASDAFISLYQYKGVMFISVKDDAAHSEWHGKVIGE